MKDKNIKVINRSYSSGEDANEVLISCEVDLEELRAVLNDFIVNELTSLKVKNNSEIKPTASFQRVVQRAAHHVQMSGSDEVTGANILVAIFSERESHAVFYLHEQQMTRFDAVSFISHGNNQVTKTEISVGATRIAFSIALFS